MMNRISTTILVCRYAMEKKQVSNRSMARMLGINHSTWLRYMRGMYTPGRAVKYKLVRLMQVASYEELIQLATRHRLLKRRE